MGPDAAHEEGVGRIPPQDSPQDGGEVTAERTGRRVDLPPTGGYDGGVGLTGGGGIRLLPLEQIHTVYHD